MGVFSGFGGTGGNDISYGYRLRQWLQDNEDNRKIELPATGITGTP